MDKGVMIKTNKSKVLFLKEEYADGDGAFVYPNRSKYEGHWEGGLRNGFGVLTLRDGSKYKGQHKKGFRHGKGVEILRMEKSILEIG